MVTLKQCSIVKEYEKNPDISEEDIKKLREWLKTQPHLPEEHISDLDLILIYHSCERSAEVAKQTLDLNITLRTHLPFFKEMYFDDRLQYTMEISLLTVLPQRAEDGSVYLYSRFLNPKKYVTDHEVMRVFIMSMEMWQYEQGTWPGFIFMVDLKGLGFGHLTKVTLNGVQQFLYYLQEALPAKLKAVHFVNAPSVADRLMSIMKPFIKQSLLQFIHVHPVGEVNDLPDVSNLEIDKLRDEALEKFKSNGDFFKQQTKKNVDESKRPGSPKNISDIFGVEGSFKKLEID